MGVCLKYMLIMSTTTAITISVIASSHLAISSRMYKNHVQAISKDCQNILSLYFSISLSENFPVVTGFPIFTLLII